jgi:hypothetical protein
VSKPDRGHRHYFRHDTLRRFAVTKGALDARDTKRRAHAVDIAPVITPRRRCRSNRVSQLAIHSREGVLATCQIDFI